MKNFAWTTAVLAIASLGCAPTTTTQRTIEPGGETTSATGPVNEGEFVLSREPATGVAERADFPIHIEGKWEPFRAEYLRLTVDQATKRDRAIKSAVAPKDFWDEQTAIESVSIWSALCNECHGGRRKIRDAVQMPVPPTKWGQGEGLFFGQRRPYVEIFDTISNGGPPLEDGTPSEMPEWGKRLAREQIWSLIYFLEYQSGGVEGRFPPSLYPRQSN